MPSPSLAASIMEHFAEHDAAHGYSQGPQRYGDGSIEKLIIGNTVVYIAGGDRDCSLGILDALKAAGFDIGSADYTGNMRPNLVARGWRWHPMGDGYIAKRGDIYLSEEHHTAMCVSDVPDMSRCWETTSSMKPARTLTLTAAPGMVSGRFSNIRKIRSSPPSPRMMLPSVRKTSPLRMMISICGSPCHLTQST